MGSLALPLPSSSRPDLASSLSGSRVPEGRADVRNASLDLCQNHHCITSATFYWTKQVRRWPQIQGERKSLQSFFFFQSKSKSYLFAYFPPFWKRSWGWERLKAGGEKSDRRWDGWMASPTQWTWVWANSGRWWRTGKPGVLQSMGSHRFGHDWTTEHFPP